MIKKSFICFIVMIVCVSGAFALKYDYYGTVVTVSSDTNHQVTEYIGAYFETPSHGLERFIPLKFRGSRARVSGVVCSDPVSERTENGFKVLRIGDPDTLISGSKEYELSYNYYTGKDFVKNEDVFYFNLLGTENECKTDYFESFVIIPLYYAQNDKMISLSEEDLNISLFRGFYGDERDKNPVSYVSHIEDDCLVINCSATDLRPGEGITILVGLPEGYFSGKDSLLLIRTIFYAVSVLLIVLAYPSYRKYGVDEPSIVTARFSPPDGLSPMYVGYLADNSVDGKDISAMLFYWADKGYIRIEELEKGNYQAVKLVSELEGAPIAERNLFKGLFNSLAKDNVLNLHKISPEKMSDVVSKCKRQVEGYFEGNRAIEEQSSSVKSQLFAVLAFVPLLLFSVYHTFVLFQIDMIVFSMYISIFPLLIISRVLSSVINNWKIKKKKFFSIAGIVLLYAIMLVSFKLMFNPLNVPYLFFAVICSSVILFISKFITKKSAYGRRITDEMLGFREFIEKVEMEQLRLLINDDPDFYYHILCYAIVLRLEKKWADKFKFVTLQNPAWYSGTGAFEAVMFSRIAGTIATSVNMSVAERNASHTVSTVSSLGGGFSGGGFGGGGSRSW